MSVWLWGITDRKRNFFHHGTDLNGFIDYTQNLKGKSPKIYFHNLRYDGSFIISWLLHNGYQHSERINDVNQFSSIITDTGLFYEIAYSINGKIITLHDSFKKIPIALAQMSKAYGLGINKLDMDYSKRAVGHVPTLDEIEYQKNDVYIPAEVLDIQYSQGLTKMTSSADAMEDYKNRIGKDKFKQLYPILPNEVDMFCRQSYKGGITFVKPEIANVEVGEGVVYDVHSMYPGRMIKELLPYGNPIFIKGDVKPSMIKDYPLYIIHITADFEVKSDHMPSIQIKNDIRFSPTKYIEKSNGDVDLWLTSIDYQLFKTQYDVYNVIEHGAYYFKGATGLFDDYINYWYGIKEDKSQPKGIRTISKLYLNGLYGKFGTNPKNTLKIPYLDDEGVLRFESQEQPDRESVYVPMASFITSYARKQIVDSAQSVWPYFCYCDTDSVHLTAIPDGLDLNDYLDITDDKIGTWGLESYFSKAVFYRAKTYKEEIEGKTMVKCAGLKSDIVKDLEFNDFEIGVVFEQLKSRQVKGGIELYIAPFEVKWYNSKWEMIICGKNNIVGATLKMCHFVVGGLVSPKEANIFHP